jgi:hypothetical protein
MPDREAGLNRHPSAALLNRGWKHEHVPGTYRLMSAENIESTVSALDGTPITLRPIHARKTNSCCTIFSLT